MNFGMSMWRLSASSFDVSNCYRREELCCHELCTEKYIVLCVLCQLTETIYPLCDPSVCSAHV